MKITLAHRIFSFICLVLAVFLLIKPAGAQNFLPVEKLMLFTDRTYYIAGENISFSVSKIAANKSSDSLSRVVLIEVISPDGTQRASGKFLFSDHLAAGAITIPEEALTGMYYLRAYTKYMRNKGPQAYAYVPIWIINPKSTDLLSIDKQLDTITLRVEKMDSTSHYFKISTDRIHYSKKQTVHVKLEPTSNLRDLEQLSISVIPDQSFEAIIFAFPQDTKPLTGISYLPETRGLSISGTVQSNSIDQDDGATIINLSIIGQGHDFMANRTDAKGRFQFSLPGYTGKRDLFLCPENKENREMKILIDNDFCSLPVNLPSKEFKLSENQQNMLLKMARNKQVQILSPVYQADTTEESKVFTEAFYGKPKQIIQLDEYVELPTLEEYFNELPTLVKVRKKQGKKYFKVVGDDAESMFFDPLVLVDWVAIDKPEKILGLSPKNIDRIEVVNEPYIKGDMLYGGIVHIVSKDGYFANIDLPSTGLFIDYQFLTPPTHLVTSIPNNLPDARNTLYWNPNVSTTEKTITFQFQTADSPGRYQIVVQGITKDFKRFAQSYAFEVK